MVYRQHGKRHAHFTRTCVLAGREGADAGGWVSAPALRSQPGAWRREYYNELPAHGLATRERSELCQVTFALFVAPRPPSVDSRQARVQHACPLA